jgi:hypothetical protein
MKQGRVVELRAYKSRWELPRKLTRAGEVKPLPDRDHLWELLDRNISVDFWKEDK